MTSTPGLPSGLVLTGKAYVVAIPIAALDHRGQPLDDERVRDWTRRALRELTDCSAGRRSCPRRGRASW